MKENHLVILCLFISLVGVLLFYFADKNLEPKRVFISEISLEKNYVIFNATIISIKRTESAIFLKLKDDTGIIDAVIFDEKIDTANLTTGMHVTVIGKTKKYKEKIEVLPLSIVT